MFGYRENGEQGYTKPAMKKYYPNHRFTLQPIDYKCDGMAVSMFRYSLGEFCDQHTGNPNFIVLEEYEKSHSNFG